MSTDPAAATLAGIKQRHRCGYTSNPHRDYCYADNQDWPCAVSSLVGALEAVLKLADDSTVLIYGHAPGRQGPIAWTLDPAEVRETITAELTGTGKEGSDE